MSKALTLILIAVLVLSGLVLTGYVFAQSVTKPSVPEFTVELVDTSYDVPTTYQIDPYTGENVTYEGYHVNRQNIELKVTNQPFTSYYDENLGQNINFYYNIRIKGHFTGDWIELYNPSDGFPIQWYDSSYTEFSYIWGGEGNTLMGSKSIYLPAGGEVDFQVEAMIGYVHRSGEPPWFPWTFYGETSGWSSTKTLTIVEIQTPSPEPTPTSSPEPTAPTSPTPFPTDYTGVGISETEIIIGLAIIVALVIVGLGLLLYFIKRK